MYHKILVPLDGSPLAECVLPHVSAIVRGCEVKEIIFLQVIEPFETHIKQQTYFTEETMQLIETARKDNALKYFNDTASRVRYGVRAEVVMGRAAECITDYATKNEVDLIVIATHGRSGVRRWVFGNVAHRVLRSACVPVLMVRAPGCVPGI